MRSESERVPAAVDGVLITDDVLRRSAPEHAVRPESDELLAFLPLLAGEADVAMQRLLQYALDRCRAGSAAVCTLEFSEDGEDVLRWVAGAGAAAKYVGSVKPRHSSPCGFCVDRAAPQAFLQPARQFAYLAPLELHEVVVVPVRQGTAVAGVLWISSHDAERHFTCEDVQLLERLSALVAVSLRTRQLQADVAVATEARDSLLLKVAHELRQPVHTILGWIDMLQQGAIEPARMATAYAAIEQSADAQAQLVSDLLDLSQLATGALHVTAAPVNVCDVVRALVDHLMPHSRTRNVVVDCEIEEPVRLALANEQRVRQIVSNLVLNAIKFTPEDGRVLIRVREAGDHVEISVKDTGVGVKSDFLDTMFDPFQQSDNRVQGRERGVGIGLTIVKELVKACDGTIHAHSDGIGRGTTVTVTFPLAADLPVSVSPSASC